MAKSSFTVDISGREHLEQWRPIPGFEGYYEASNLGRIRGVDRWITTRSGFTAFRRGQLLSQRVLDGNGYLIVMMSKHGQYQNRLVHRLVLSAFVGLAPEGTECCHNNGDRRDNRIENLRWDTKLANTEDQFRHGTHRSIGDNCGRGHAFTLENTYMRPRGTRECRACRISRGEIKGKYRRRREASNS